MKANEKVQFQSGGRDYSAKWNGKKYGAAMDTYYLNIDKEGNFPRRDYGTAVYSPSKIDWKGQVDKQVALAAIKAVGLINE